MKSADVATSSQSAIGELSDVHDVPLLPVYAIWLGGNHKAIIIFVKSADAAMLL